MRKAILLTATAGVMVLTAACLHSVPSRSQDAMRRLVTAKAKIMSADYRADLDELARLRQEVLPLAGQPEAGYLAHYWAGFASWRLAINGASSRGMSAENLKSHLTAAAADFDTSVRLRDDFADGYAAAAQVKSWLAAFHRGDAAAVRELLASSRQMLARAKDLAPENPRVLWALGGSLLFTPAEYGGNPERAIETYRRMVQAAEAPVPASSPLPDWGKPEALMSLAYAHLNQAAPDLNAAAEEAHAALQLQPEWFYVREILVPQIEAAQRKVAGACGMR
jgi:hypothetical protein